MKSFPMHSMITDIIARFGGRLAGTAQEDMAQDYVRGLMDGFCDKAFMHRFVAPMEAMHGSLKLFCLVYLAALVLYQVSLPLAFVLALANAVFFLGHFLNFRFWLDSLFSGSESSNAIGVIQPRGEVRSTLILSGHGDSTYEYQWWYWLKNLGGFLTGLCGIMFLALPLFYGLDLFFACGSCGYWCVFLCLSPVLAVFFFMRSGRVVPGAQDNLSGVAVAMGAGEVLSGRLDEKGTRKPLLEHTRVMIVSFGAEEAGIRGSFAFVKDFSDILDKSGTVCINADGIMRQKDLRIIKAEYNPMVFYPKDLADKLSKAFSACGQEPKTGRMAIGATDAAPFARHGIPSITIVGIPIHKMDPTYHTRLDRPEFVMPDALEKTRDIMVAFAMEWDRELRTP